LCLRGPKAQLVSAFSAKCTSMVVRLHIALRKDLAKTRAELAEEKAQVQRRVFLVIKEAVREWRRENGYRHTDCTWRLKNFTQCCKRLLGHVYHKGNTPYVKVGSLRRAHESIKYFYGLCQMNPPGEQPHYEQTTISKLFGL
jgi:hypothetical protein